jgi:hypothetical protein
MSGKGAERSRGEKHLGEEWRKEYTEGVASPLGTFPDIQLIEDCGRSAVLNFLHNSLRTTARGPTIEAFVARAIPDHERPTFRTRGRIFLQSEWKALFRNCRYMSIP